MTDHCWARQARDIWRDLLRRQARYPLDRQANPRDGAEIHRCNA